MHSGKTLQTYPLFCESMRFDKQYVPTKIEAEFKVDGVVVFKFSYKATLTNLNIAGIASSGVASYDLSITISFFVSPNRHPKEFRKKHMVL
jgi:hypothetical protein